MKDIIKEEVSSSTMVPKKLSKDKIINAIVNLALENPMIKLDAIYLHGSFLKNNNYGDIDLILVSDCYEGLSKDKRKEISKINYPIILDLMCLTKEELSSILKIPNRVRLWSKIYG